MDAFYKLEGLCPAHTNLAALDAWQLGRTCLDTTVFAPSTIGLILIIAQVVIGPGFLIWARIARGDDASVVVGGAFESVFYTAFGGYAGLVGGVAISLIVPPVILGIIFAILTVVCLLFMIVGAIRGTGGAGWKVAGILEMLPLCAGLGLIAVYAFRVPGAAGAPTAAYSELINAVALGLGFAGALHGFFSAYLRGTHWWLSPIVLAINASWGFIGNILGLFTFLTSWNDWANHGDHDGNRRWGYLCFHDGMSLKTSNDAGRTPFAFTQGAVVSARTGDLERHEMIHVIQHYVWGPLYPISHNVWFVIWAVVGLFAAPAKGIGVDEAVTALSYYDNPWEVMAYETYGGRDPTQPLIWSKLAGWLIAVPWILAWTAGGIVFLLWRLRVL